MMQKTPVVEKGIRCKLGLHTFTKHEDRFGFSTTRICRRCGAVYYKSPYHSGLAGYIDPTLHV